MKIEMHAHTAEVSPCANVYAKDMIKACKEKEYSAVVITDHFNSYILEEYSGNNRQKVKRYLKGYETAKEFEEEIGIKVFFGIEVCLKGGREDFLVYGVTPEFLYDNYKLYNLSQKELYNIAHDAGALVYQAHPCRSYCQPKDPFLMDGAEVYNGNYLHGGPLPGSSNNNDKALRWAKKYPHLLYVSGSDIHNYEDVGASGITIPDKEVLVKEKDLVHILKSEEMKLITIESFMGDV